MNKRTLLGCLMALLFFVGLDVLMAQVEIPLNDKSDGNPALTDPESAYLHMLRQNQITGSVDPLDVQNAYQQIRGFQRSKKSANLNLAFSSLGPDNYGGRTRAIVVDRNNPSTLYAGSSGGGVWKSTSNGSSWVPLTVNGSPNQIIQVSCMLQTANGVLYAGTGESWYAPTGAFGKGGFYGTGLYKSTNGNDFVPVAGTAGWNFINELAAHQTRLWIATEQGLFYSDDEATWTLAKDAAGNNLNGNATDVKVGTNGIVVAAVNNMCYISETGGVDAFVNHSTGTTGKLPVTNVGRVEFAIAPSNPDIMYASIASQIGTVLGIYRSENKGVTWSIIGPGASPSFGVFAFPTGSSVVYEGILNNTITVYPNNPDLIMVGGVDLWQGLKVANEGFFAWNQTTSHAFDPLSGLGPLYLHKGINQIVFRPNSPNEAYFATDGGVFLGTQFGFQGRHKNYKTNNFYTVHAGGDGAVMGGTADNGVMLITGKGNTSEEGQIIFDGPGSYSLFSLVDPDVMIVSRTGGVVRRSIDYGLDYSAAFGTNINMTNITATYLAPLVLWESFYDYTSRDSVWYVADTNYVPGQNIEVRSHNGHYPFNVEAPFALAKGDTLRVQDPVVSRLFFGATNGIYMTDNILDFTDLPRWAKIADFVGTVQTLTVSKDGNYLFAGMQNGTLLRFSGISTYKDDTTYQITRDTIATWTGRVITSIAISPSNNNRLMVTLGNYGNTDYVYGSVNATDPVPVFTSWQGNLPPMPVYSSLIELHDANRLLVGSEFGLFSAYYNGATLSWTLENNGMPAVPVFNIYQQTTLQHTKYALEVQGLDSLWVVFPGVTNYGAIYFATQGRGVYRSNTFVGIDDNPLMSQSSGNSMSIYPNPSNGKAQLRFEIKETNTVSYQVFDLNGRMVKTANLAELPAGTYDIPVELSGMKQGVYLLRLLLDKGNSRSVKLIIN